MHQRSHPVADRLDGSLVMPDDPEYDRARGAWNLMYAHRPSLVIEARSTQDVVEAVNLAGAIGARVAVQATGHGFTSPADEGVLILTAGLDKVEVDDKARRARVGRVSPGRRYWPPPRSGDSPRCSDHRREWEPSVTPSGEVSAGWDAAMAWLRTWSALSRWCWRTARW